jgi:hypothetical protein
MSRIRFDLDGIPLDDEDGRTTAIFRYRTTKGLILALPESVDVTVPWNDIEMAQVDLKRGRISVRITSEARARHRWLGPAQVLVGTWTDRELLKEDPRHGS